jgi:ubiquinone/menaquinone biosynthesis C-methylase UbiE
MTPAHRTCDDAAGVPAPGGMEIFTTRLMLHGLLSGSYRRFVDAMGLRGDERVLDFGAGSGAAARHLAKRLQTGGHLTCVDVSPVWQREARKSLRAYANVDYALGDIRELELSPGSYDVVVMHWMLHDVPAADRRPVLAALARLLRPGGRVYTREPSRKEEGIEVTVLRNLLGGAGLSELRGTSSSSFWMGPHYAGVWEKRSE